MALTKAEMAERLFLEVGLNKREAKEFVDAYFEVVREALEKGEQVKLSGFGNFDLRQKNQRPGLLSRQRTGFAARTACARRRVLGQRRRSTRSSLHDKSAPAAARTGSPP